METSLFNKLSGELRNHIYELALLEGDATSPFHPESQTVNLEQGWFDCPFHRSKIMEPARTGGGHRHALEPLRVTGLPLTCKSIRKESLRLWFSLNRFVIEMEYLKSRHQERIMGRLVEWVERVGREQAREIRDVTVSLAALKGAARGVGGGGGGDVGKLDWEHMRVIKGLFHPKAIVRFRFFVDGLGTVTFRLGRREVLMGDLERMARGWGVSWQRSRKYSVEESSRTAERYRVEIARLFEDMPEEV
ncbi:Hypothetical predicted protein [Lecanosticta acicola]|uniref:Uncharacterized protein n=1 Tax=Lecanosticta acicola TaxID=111012 RepID=A0AAI8YRR6_9PEZI|nr:Hypothetical predicted protein [Lecanosticta acicola]